MATEVAPILVPRADDAAGQHTPTAAHTPGSPMPMSPVMSPKVAKPTDPVELAAAIRKQVEFYFSDANLPTDKHLLKQISRDPEGYVPLKMIANFKRVKGLTKELSVVTEALKGSSMLSVDEEGSRVRRTTPLPAYDTSDICRRTVVAEHLPDKPTIESVTQLFVQYGSVAMVRICSRGSTGKLPSWLNKAVEAINMGVGNGEFALVEFATEDECVHCVTKTKNPDNWRTSLRVRHLLPNFKPAGRSKGGRSSETGGPHEPGHSSHGGHHGTSSNNNSSGGGSVDATAGVWAPALHPHAGAYQPPGRRSLDFLHPPHQHQQTCGSSGSSSGGEEGPGAAATSAAASAAASAATAGLLSMHLSPIRTQPASSGGGSKGGGSSGGGAAAAVPGRMSVSSSAGGAASPLPGAPSPIKVGSPMKHSLGGVGGCIGSPRSVKSPAPADVASRIDNILSAPTGGTPTRDGQRNSSSAGGRWSSGSGLGIEVAPSAGAHPGSQHSSPAAHLAAAAALAGVKTPPQASSPRASSSGTRESIPGALPRTPTRMSAAGAAAAAAASSSGGGAAHSPVASPMAAHAAAFAAMTGSPTKQAGSNAANWRSGNNTPNSSMPGTPLSDTQLANQLSISAGAAVGAALDGCWSPQAGASGAFSVGSPNLSSGGAGKPAPWVPASRLAHHQRMATASGGGGSSSEGGGGAADGDHWRSGGSSKVLPPRSAGGSRGGSRTPTQGSSGGGSSAGGSRQRRKSWHATESDEAAIAAGAGASAADATGAADGSTSDSSSSVRKSGRQASRLGQGGDYQATIEAIREASCELDMGTVGRAIAQMGSKGRSKGGKGSTPGGSRRASETGAGSRRASETGADSSDIISPEGDAGADGAEGDHAKRRRPRHRRSRSSGSRRQSLDEARPATAFGTSLPSAGMMAAGLSPRGVGAGRHHHPLAPEDGHHGRHNAKHSSGGGGDEHRGASAGGHEKKKKEEKKDYAAWAAATAEYRVLATGAKHSSGGGAGAAMLGTSPGHSSGISPLRGQAMQQHGHTPSGSPAPGSQPHHAHHLEHTARGPDGTRGFAMGRGRPLTPAAP